MLTSDSLPHFRFLPGFTLENVISTDVLVTLHVRPLVYRSTSLGETKSLRRALLEQCSKNVNIVLDEQARLAKGLHHGVKISLGTPVGGLKGVAT